jgi:hypothetical protein
MEAGGTTLSNEELSTVFKLDADDAAWWRSLADHKTSSRELVSVIQVRCMA